jgi:hypothetical protein
MIASACSPVPRQYPASWAAQVSRQGLSLPALLTVRAAEAPGSTPPRHPAPKAPDPRDRRQRLRSLTVEEFARLTDRLLSHAASRSWRSQAVHHWADGVRRLRSVDAEARLRLAYQAMGGRHG